VSAGKAEALVDELLSDSRSVVRGLLQEEPWALPNLARLLDGYERSLHRDARPTTDLDTADALLAGCRALLQAIGPTPAPDAAHLTHVAVRYFVLEEDGDGDQSSPFGFDDDVEVFNAVVRLLGHPRLQIH